MTAPVAEFRIVLQRLDGKPGPKCREEMVLCRRFPDIDHTSMSVWLTNWLEQRDALIETFNAITSAMGAGVPVVSATQAENDE